MNFYLKIKYIWGFGFTPVGLQICVIQVLHNIILGGISSTGENSTSCNMHMEYARLFFKFINSVYKTFLGLQQGMQMLEVSTTIY